MIQQFPRTTVGGVSMPRLLIGTNWLLSSSLHTGAAADQGIREKFSKPENSTRSSALTSTTASTPSWAR